MIRWNVQLDPEKTHAPMPRVHLISDTPTRPLEQSVAHILAACAVARYPFRTLLTVIATRPLLGGEAQCSVLVRNAKQIGEPCGIASIGYARGGASGVPRHSSTFT
jgi:hypothetical protein